MDLETVIKKLEALGNHDDLAGTARLVSCGMKGHR